LVGRVVMMEWRRKLVNGLCMENYTVVLCASLYGDSIFLLV
jgi:hypothetical protein